jgi:hypothetical protein
MASNPSIEGTSCGTPRAIPRVIRWNLPLVCHPQLLDEMQSTGDIDPMRVAAAPRFREWINALKDMAGRARIQVQIDRLIHGSPGRHTDLAGGISELNVDSGPG